MMIDIDQLTESELFDLSHRIAARLRFVREMRTHTEMLEFRIGERVAFQPPGHCSREGIVTKYNKKTLTVIADDAEHWNVPPSCLRKVRVNATSPSGANVILLGKR
jgi:hypothetical protein